ncbi:MAG: hypothetical protein ACOY3P_26305 [Planctomycetota bacterium]
MQTTHLFAKKREFMEWIRAISSGTSEPHTRVVFGYDPISWSVKAIVVAQGHKPLWGISELTLPIRASQAREVWDSIQEDNLCLFFCLKLDLGIILVAARNGAWRSLDDQYLPYKKSLFAEVSDNEAKKLVGDSEAWSALCREVQLFGVGCRVLVHV